MKRITTIVSLVIILIAGTATATPWSMLGGDPNELTLNESLDRLHFPIDAERVKQTVWYGQPEFIKLESGTEFTEMIFGDGKVVQNCKFEYDGLALAIRWEVDGLYVYYIPRCGNVGWQYIQSEEEIIPGLIPNAPDAVTQVPDNDDSGGGIPGWFKILFWWVMAALMVAIALWVIVRLLSSMETHHPPTNQSPTTTTLTPETTTGPEDEEVVPEDTKKEPPTPEPAKENKLVKLRELTTELSVANTKSSDLKTQIKDLKTEINTDLESIDEITKPAEDKNSVE